MNSSKLKFKDIDGYHALFPVHIQIILEQLRKTIKKVSPNITETISYGMPAFRQNKVLVYYAVHKEHIGFYPTPNPIKYFKKDLAKYNTSKGAIQFPLNKRVPLNLISRIVMFRLKEDNSQIKVNTLAKSKSSVKSETKIYNNNLTIGDKAICNKLAGEISKYLSNAENKIWHGHPVWFINGNPIVGYSKQKPGIRLMFWSGKSFNEEKLGVRGEKFKDASIFYNDEHEINSAELKRWLKKSEKIQWDYKNLIKRKGKLVKLK